MRLVVHIGAGKTGSSSIQSELERATDALENQRAKYLGLMLEHAYTDNRFDWQKHPGSPVFFHEIPKEQAIEELEKALSEEISAARNHGIETLIWSNEWIYGRDDRVIPALKKISEQGVDIDIAAYVRRHDKWAVSAYMQWGIKNKQNNGSILTFKQWVDGRRFDFANTLDRWTGELGEVLHVFNYDVVEDVGQHFFNWLGIPHQIGERDNVTPSSEVLAAWAVYNNRFKRPVPMNRFQQFLRRINKSNENGTSVTDFARLLPVEEDIVAIREQHESDMARINAMLERSGEKPLELAGPIKLPKAPSEVALNNLMLEMIFNLHDRVSGLERRLKQMEDDI